MIHTFEHYGRISDEANTAVIVRGNADRGAIKILNKLGMKVTTYDRHTENL